MSAPYTPSSYPYWPGNYNSYTTGVVNNQITTTVTNYASGGAVNNTSNTTVNVVPQTYLTSVATTTLVNGTFTNVFSYGTLQPGIYITSFSYSAVMASGGVAGDYVDTRLYGGGISNYPTERQQYVFIVAGVAIIYGTATFQFKLTSPVTVTLQADNVSVAGVSQYNVYPYVTLQKIG